MSQKSSSAIAVIGIDIGKNVFHLVGQDRRGAIVLRHGEIGLPGACEHWWPQWPGRGLTANQIACALISMMAVTF